MLITTSVQTAHRDSKIVCPQFESAKLFPPKHISGYQPSVGMTKDKIVTKWFVFDNSTVASRRAKYSDNTSEACPLCATRVEALSPFIWKRYATVTLVEPRAETLHIVLYAVNLRTRIDPPLPVCYFNNLYRVAMSMPTMETVYECGGLVRQMRDNKEYRWGLCEKARKRERALELY